jgi:hypothetical protein
VGKLKKATEQLLHIGDIDDLELERKECQGIWLSFLDIFYGIRAEARRDKQQVFFGLVSLSYCLYLGAN